MAISVFGIPESIDGLHWARLFQEVGDARAGCAVVEGLTVTAAGSTLTVAPGKSLQAGSLAVSDAASTVPNPINSSSTARTNVLCLQVDWSGTQTTAGQFVVVPGSSLSVPALAQTEGVLWQTPLYRYQTAAGSSAVTGLVKIQPVPSERTCSGSFSMSNGQTVTVAFPYGFFTAIPRVVLTPQSGAAETTISNYFITHKEANAFAASLQRSTSTTVTFDWIASGV